MVVFLLLLAICQIKTSPRASGFLNFTEKLSKKMGVIGRNGVGVFPRDLRNALLCFFVAYAS